MEEFAECPEITASGAEELAVTDPFIVAETVVGYRGGYRVIEEDNQQGLNLRSLWGN